MGIIFSMVLRRLSSASLAPATNSARVRANGASSTTPCIPTKIHHSART